MRKRAPAFRSSLTSLVTTCLAAGGVAGCSDSGDRQAGAAKAEVTTAAPSAFALEPTTWLSVQGVAVAGQDGALENSDAVAGVTHRAAVTITAAQVIVQGSGIRAVIDRAPAHVSFQDGSGNTVLQQVPNVPAYPTPLPQTVDPAPYGGPAQPSTAVYSPFFYEVGTEVAAQWPYLFYAGDMFESVRGGYIFSATSVVSATQVGTGAQLVLATNDPTGRTLTVNISPDGSGRMRVTAAAQPTAGVMNMGDAFASTADEAFHGFGGRHTGVDQRGRAFYSWSEEENFGGGVIPQFASLYPPNAATDPHYMFPNGPMAAYYPQNLFVSSNPYGFLINQDAFTRWRLTSDRPDAWQVSVSSSTLDYTVAAGRGDSAVRALTGIVGRERLPPAWGQAPTLSRPVQAHTNPVAFTSPADYIQKVTTYTQSVDADLAQIEALTRARDPLVVGSYAFEGAAALDPTFRQSVVARLHALGVHPIMYVRSFVSVDTIVGKDPALTQDSSWFNEAVGLGLVTKKADGTPFIYSSTYYNPPDPLSVLTPAAVIDFTNPAAVTWYEGKVRGILDQGADGFMLDFGEQITNAMVFANSETGATMHNQYPSLYAKVTRDIVSRYETDHPERGTILFYTRAGFSGAAHPGLSGRSGTSASVAGTFPGDETTDWTVSSGIGSLVPDMVNRGLGGAYGYNTDIGGYADFIAPPTSKELFIRWTELAALTPYMRVHNSALAGGEMPWSYDAETLAIWNQYARLHELATPLIRALWDRSVRTGAPVIRPLWLQFPWDGSAGSQNQEFMLGDDLLIAPVVTQGATVRDVYFPRGSATAPGTWVDVENGEVHAGGTMATVNAPLGKLPIFFLQRQE